MYVKETIKKLGVYQAGKPIEEVQKEFGLNDVIKLASNENPYGCSPQALAATKSFSDMAIYPDSNATTLKELLAKHYLISNDQLFLGNGSDEIIQLLCRGILHKGCNSVMATPSFPQYKHNSLVEGAEVREVPLENGVHNLAEMARQVDANTKIVWICNPNNPTGTYVNHKDLQQFLSNIPSQCLVVIDEAYVEYVEAQEFPNSLSLINQFKNVLILRTFSKAYGLAAIRVGYAIGCAEVINQLNIIRAPFNVGKLSQTIAAAAIKDQAFVRDTFSKNREQLNRYVSVCEELNLHYFPSETNFILVHVGRSGEAVFHELLKQGVIVRPGEKLGYPNYVRITIGTKEENDIAIPKIKNTILS
jgi:histidinol-phosphate aminotransferase